MEKLVYWGSPTKMEIFLLIMYTIYTGGIIISGARPSLENWTDFMLIAVLISSWFFRICKYRNYKFRATYTSIMMQISLILYTFHEQELRHALPVFIVFVVMVGLYGIAENIYMTVITTIIVFGYHILGSRTIPLETVRDVVSLIQRLTNVLFVEFLVFVWTKRNFEDNNKLIGMIEELEKVESSKDDFVANVSHEIRTPINTICGMSEIILNEELPLDIKEKVMDIQRAGRSLMGVVSDILDFSELQSEEIKMEEESYYLSSTLNDVVNMALAYKSDKKIDLVVECDPQIPSGLLGDEKKIRRVIMKLMNNAIKFTESGSVTLSVGYRKEEYGINLSFMIKDTGIGIREESLEKLFTTFSQVDSSRKRQAGGLGLGLAISQALVQKMGGTITVKSKWGKGTTVRFVVPQKVVDETPMGTIHNRRITAKVSDQVEQKQKESAAPKKIIETGNVHVLIVDDNSMNLRVAEEMLTTYGIKVTKAYSGQEALDKITSMNYDFVFMDHMMPQMDGVETLHHIRKKIGTYYQNVPIIALTANAVAGNREKLLKEGFDDFLEKPIERSVLERVLRRTLPEDKFATIRNVRTTEIRNTAENNSAWLSVLEDCGLDVKKAILYCNGKEAYYKILQGYCLEGEKTEKQLEDLYQKQDWKNYTIAVHGLKSAMHSVGALKVSEIAKLLEMAGKNQDIDYILEHHNQLMVEFKYLFTKLRINVFGEGSLKMQESLETKPEVWENSLDTKFKCLGAEEFDDILSEMENAVFSLDSVSLLKIISELKSCSYAGKAMDEVIKKAERKIEMSDFFSAVEMIAHWKENAEIGEI